MYKKPGRIDMECFQAWCACYKKKIKTICDFF